MLRRTEEFATPPQAWNLTIQPSGNPTIYGYKKFRELVGVQNHLHFINISLQPAKTKMPLHFVIFKPVFSPGQPGVLSILLHCHTMLQL